MSNTIRVIVNEYGEPITEIPENIEEMTSPVLCNYCGDVYDLTAVKPIHRYMDCTTFATPCCDKTADDRMWVNFPAFKRINKDI